MSQFNAETTATLSGHLQSYYQKRFLDRLMVKFHFQKFGMPARIPSHNSKTIVWNRWGNVSDSTSALTEGESPDGIDMTSSQITAAVAQYGQFATATDMLILTAINDTLNDYVDLLSYAAAKSLDALTRNEVDANATTQLAAASASVAAVQADTTAIFKANEIRKAVKTLRNSDVDEWEDGLFRAIIHPFAEFDLLSETAANGLVVAKSMTEDKTIQRGEIGNLFGVKFHRSSHIRAESTPNTNVYKNMIFGKNAYGTVELDSMGLNLITKQLGSGGTEDPLNQRATVGYKFAYVTKTLDANRMIVVKAYGA